MSVQFITAEIQKNKGAAAYVEIKQSIHTDIATSVGIQAGDRIEVLWYIHDGSDIDETTRKQIWWGCVCGAPVTGKMHRFDNDIDESQVLVQVYTIKYDALPPHFPQPSINESCFLSDQKLYDLQFEGVLTWRYVNKKTNDILCTLESTGNNINSIRQKISSIMVHVIIQIEEDNREMLDTMPIEKQLVFNQRVSTWRQLIIDTTMQHVVQHGILTTQHFKQIIKDTKLITQPTPIVLP